MRGKAYRTAGSAEISAPSRLHSAETLPTLPHHLFLSSSSLTLIHSNQLGGPRHSRAPIDTTSLESVYCQLDELDGASSRYELSGNFAY
jgi:hypothetical protein